MTSKAALRLKANWKKMPAKCFEPLTFGELEVGQKFIVLPSPGDNHGHDGFRIIHHIFVKTDEIVRETAAGLPYKTPHGRAVNISRGVSSDIHHSMYVICVE